MGTAVLTLTHLFRPLQALAERMRRFSRQGPHPLRYIVIRPACTVRDPRANSDATVSRAPMPLRVIRMVEPRRQSVSSRMVISGRMADVCAELDRLAALEQRHESETPPH